MNKFNIYIENMFGIEFGHSAQVNAMDIGDHNIDILLCVCVSSKILSGFSLLRSNAFLTI
jgi:hypothetical protein